MPESVVDRRGSTVPARDLCLVHCTVPDAATGERIAEELVNRRLAACVSLAPGLRSVYRWQGRVEKADEVLLLIKTTRARLPALARAILGHHPYELPEILAVPVDEGLEGYTDWIRACTTAE